MARDTAAFRARYGPWAVVAGASEGLGAAYADQIAARGIHVALVARRADRLASLAADLERRHGVQTRTLALDLAQPDGAAQIAPATTDLDVGLVVYNAALSLIGPFLERPLVDHLAELTVNCQGPLTLADAFGRRLAARGRGGLILMSSLSASVGSALIANYAATKAYNQILAEGLWEEWRRTGVDVLACCASAVTTPNYAASGARSRQPGTMAPEAVARAALAALGTAPSFIPGATNRLNAFFLRRLLPRRFAVGMMGGVLHGMYAQPL